MNDDNDKDRFRHRGMLGIERVREIYPGLDWRQWPSANGLGEIWAAQRYNNPVRKQQGHEAQGECNVLLYMCDGAAAPLHTHRSRWGWPYSEAISVSRGRIKGWNPQDPEAFLVEGNSVDLRHDAPHAPEVLEGEDCLLDFHQPGGSDLQRPLKMIRDIQREHPEIPAQLWSRGQVKYGGEAWFAEEEGAEFGYLFIVDGGWIPLHYHVLEDGQTQTLHVLEGTLYGWFPGKATMPLMAGMKVVMHGASPHAPNARRGEYALVQYSRGGTSVDCDIETAMSLLQTPQGVGMGVSPHS